MNIKITRLPTGVKGSPKDKLIDYQDKQFEEDKISDFRERVKGRSLVEATDHFVYLGVPIDGADEATFQLSTFKSVGKDAPLAEIEIWTKEKYDAAQKPAPPVPGRKKKLTITRTPGGVSGSEKTKTYEVTEQEYVGMTLAKLRPLLEARKYMLPEDAFVDQGLPIEKTSEADFRVSSFADSLAISSAGEITKQKKEEKWKEDAPKIDLKPYTANVEAPKLSGYDPSKDHTGQAPQGFGGVTVSGNAKRFSQISANEIEAILSDSRLYPRHDAEPACSALEVGEDDIEFARNNIVTCKQIRVNGVPCSRVDTVNFSYSENVQKWQRQLVSDSKTSASIPLVFGFDASYRQEDQQQHFQKNVTVYLTGSVALPMMRVTLDGVSVTEKFKEAVKEAVGRGSAADLMHVLAENGHFIATDFLVGGKVSYWSSKVLDEDYTSNRLAMEFKTAATGTIEAGGMPVSGGGGTGLSREQKDEITRISQKFTMKAKTYGGQGAASSSRPAELGGEWLKSVAEQPRFWTVIGYLGKLRPTLSYLDSALQDRARELLRRFFEDHLIVKMTKASGNTGPEKFEDKLDDVAALESITLHHGRLVEGIQAEYRLKNGQLRTTAIHGHKGNEKHDTIRLQPGEEIAAMEVRTGNAVDHLIFWTTQGRRYPPQEGSCYGKNGGHAVETLIAPRVRAFHGNSEWELNAIGFEYLDLANLGDVGKSALVALENYIYGR